MTPDVQRVIEFWFGDDVKVAKVHAVGGGCINKAWRVCFEDGKQVFVKEPSKRVDPDYFQMEADALDALNEPQCLRVPQVLGVAYTPEQMPLLILEFIVSGRQAVDFQATLGKQLAKLHQFTTQYRFGWPYDNHLGSSVQPNGWATDWINFVRTKRLGYQFNLARRNGHGDSKFTELANKLLDQLDTLLDCDEPACLLHGDLWSGNVMSDENGQPVILDPAVYYGQREADLAMTHLFGGFNSEFYDAYNETWPLPTDTIRRQNVYMLYHLLNHLNIFGRGYYGQCISLMQDLL
jgi:fructosamine-3-kinase